MWNRPSLKLCVLLIVFCFEESALISQSNLTGEVPEQMPSHDEYSSLSIDQTYKFMAFFVLMNEIRTRKCTVIGMAAIITDRHALTAASVIIEFLPDNIDQILLKVGTVGSFCKDERANQFLDDAIPHPRFRNSDDDPYADIAVVFFSEASIFTLNGINIAVSLVDVDENFIGTQLGWAPIVSDKCCAWTCNGTRRRFRVSLIEERPYLFKSDPIYHATKSDHGGPVFIERKRRKFELVGITSKPSKKRPALHTKIYTFLPFIIQQLKTDRCTENSPPYKPRRWINDLLRYEAIISSPFSDRFARIYTH